MYYRRALDRADYNSFSNFFNPELYGLEEDATVRDIAEIIVDDEESYTAEVARLATLFGYQLNSNAPYILGVGTTSIVYLVTRNRKQFALKFIKLVLSTLGTLLVGQELMIENDLDEYIPKIYLTYGQMGPGLGDFDGLDEFGVIIQDYVGSSLKEFQLHATKEELDKIIVQLRAIKYDFETHDLIHDDLHDENITVTYQNEDLKVYLIDLDNVKPKEQQQYSGLGRLDPIIASLQHLLND
ncbi:Hypothetical protein POVR1_LOCUS563 [uncultured virus]|nr:Hypothetical protein POVR1_LOCUS563 [uncultured virus]